MVTNPTTTAEIEQLLTIHCVRNHIHAWDLDEDHRINVHGDVILTRIHNTQGVLPLNFGHVSGDFVAKKMNLRSLAGVPHTVTGACNLAENQLTHLKGAPGHVGNILNVMRNPLVNLEGFPDHVGDAFIFTYEPDLPLLRTITCARLWPSPDQPKLEDIFLKYSGKGKSHMLNLALEWKQAGYVGNAKW